jgi:hypothetical protein
MEACVGAHHLSRKLTSLGHDARLMPAKYVRPYSRGQKNDFRDAEAIAEAVQRPTMKFVATKTAEQLDLQALHRVRERLVSQRTSIINQIRAFLLERAVAVRQGLRFLRAELPRILATPCDALSPRMLRVIEDLAGDWRRLDKRIEDLSSEIEVLARRDVGCERLMGVPGIGPTISSAMVAAIGSGDELVSLPLQSRHGQPGLVWVIARLRTTTDEQFCSCQRGDREANQCVNQCGSCVLHESDDVWRERDPKPHTECCLRLPFGLIHQCCYGDQRNHAAIQPSVPCCNIPAVQTENPWRCGEQDGAA